MRRVRCPGCSAIVQASGDVVTCEHCGLTGRVDAPTPAATKAAPKGKPRQATTRDPWQITLDLRMLNPARWPAGGRAFAVVLLIAVAFLAGGYTGVVFERTKSDVLGNLDDGLFGAGSSAAASEGTSTPTSPTSSATLTSTSTESPAPKETVQHDFTNDDAAPKVTLEGGLVKVSIMFNDQGTHSLFRLKFLDGEGAVETSLAASYTGSYTAVRYLGVAAGAYGLSVGAPGDASTWTLRIEELHGEVAQNRGATFSAHGDAGKGPLRASGDIDVSFTASKGASGQVAVKAFRADGTQIKACGTGVVSGSTSQDNQYSKSWTCDVGADTLVYFDIAHPYDPDGEWALTVG